MTETGIIAEWADIEVGGAAMRAYVARPERPGSYPGVVVGHEIYGQHESVLDATERIATLGTVAILPDLFHRAAPRAQLQFSVDRDRGLELLRTLRRADVRADVGASLDYLAQRGTTSANMIGFSAGGHVAYYAATQLPLAFTAAFYPGWLPNTDIPLSTPEPTLAGTAGITGRIALYFGGADPLIPGADRTLIDKVLRDNGIEHEVVVYDDAQHGFLFAGRDSYHQSTAEAAWTHLTDALLAGSVAAGR